MQIKHGKYESKHVYGNGNVGKKIIEILKTIEIDIQKNFYAGISLYKFNLSKFLKLSIFIENF